MKFTIILVKPRAKLVPFSWLIRWVQMTDYSHMAITIGADVLDSTLKGVAFTHYLAYINKYDIVDRIHIDVEEDIAKTFHTWADSMRFKKYSMIQNVGTIIRLIGITKSNPYGKNEKELVCSELVALFLGRFKGANLSDSDDYDLINAEMLARSLSC